MLQSKNLRKPSSIHMYPLKKGLLMQLQFVAKELADYICILNYFKTCVSV